MRLENKVAIVTGAATGIGEDIATLFAREGARVAIADLNQKGADAVAAEPVRRCWSFLRRCRRAWWVSRRVLAPIIGAASFGRSAEPSQPRAERVGLTLFLRFSCRSSRFGLSEFALGLRR
jgi:hypothetical protein